MKERARYNVAKKYEQEFKQDYAQLVSAMIKEVVKKLKEFSNDTNTRSGSTTG